MAGQSFVLRQPIPSELVRASCVYETFASTDLTTGGVMRIMFGPDGLVRNNAGSPIFLTYDSISVSVKFNAFQALYDLYMVTFIKVEATCQVAQPVITANAVSPLFSAHLSGFNDWNVVTGTIQQLSNQDKIQVTKYPCSVTNTISMAYHAQNTLPQPFLPVSSYATGGYAGLTGGLVGAVTDLKTPAIAYTLSASQVGTSTIGVVNFKVTVYYVFKDRKV